jgi:hypothetical protein
MFVNAADISVNVDAHYPGRPERDVSWGDARYPRSNNPYGDIWLNNQESAEAIVICRNAYEGLNY